MTTTRVERTSLSQFITGTLGAGQDGYAAVYEHATQRWIPGTFEPAGSVATHAALTSGVHGISAFGATLVDDTNASVARSTLELGTMATQAASAYAALATTNTFALAQTFTSGIAITTGNLTLPVTSSTVGQIQIGGAPRLHFYGTDNLFGGRSSGNFTLTGIDNVGIGRNVMTSLTSGSRNVMAGQETGKAITSGSDNTGIGRQTLLNLQGGSDNLAFGAVALLACVSGNSNVAVGAVSLFQATGSDNVAIGYSAGRNNTTGTKNTFIGYGAGWTGTTATLTNSTAIGNNAQVTASNTIVLGGTGADAVMVAIGATAATAALDLPASTTTRAALRIRTDIGTPSAPNTGDMRQDGTHCYMYLAGSWKQLDN